MKLVTISEMGPSGSSNFSVLDRLTLVLVEAKLCHPVRRC